MLNSLIAMVKGFVSLNGSIIFSSVGCIHLLRIFISNQDCGSDHFSISRSKILVGINFFSPFILHYLLVLLKSLFWLGDHINGGILIVQQRLFLVLFLVAQQFRLVLEKASGHGLPFYNYVMEGKGFGNSWLHWSRVCLLQKTLIQFRYGTQKSESLMVMLYLLLLIYFYFFDNVRNLSLLLL